MIEREREGRRDELSLVFDFFFLRYDKNLQSLTEELDFGCETRVCLCVCVFDDGLMLPPSCRSWKEWRFPLWSGSSVVCCGRARSFCKTSHALSSQTLWRRQSPEDERRREHVNKPWQVRLQQRVQIKLNLFSSPDTCHCRVALNLCALLNAWCGVFDPWISFSFLLLLTRVNTLSLWKAKRSRVGINMTEKAKMLPSLDCGWWWCQFHSN